MKKNFFNVLVFGILFITSSFAQQTQIIGTSITGEP